VPIVLFGNAIAQAGLVLVHEYAANANTPPQNPNTQGWTEISDRGVNNPPGSDAAVAVAITNDNGTGLNAWSIVDDDGNGAEDLYYLAAFGFTPDQVAKARTEGFIYRWRLRIPDVTPISRAITTEVRVQTSVSDRLRFILQMGRTSTDLAAEIIAGSAGTVTGSLPVADPGGYHDWEMRFDGPPSELRLSVDGIRLLTTTIDFNDSGHALLFGSRTSGVGTGNWNRVQFFTGVPEPATAGLLALLAPAALLRRPRRGRL